VLCCLQVATTKSCRPLLSYLTSLVMTKATVSNKWVQKKQTKLHLQIQQINIELPSTTHSCSQNGVVADRPNPLLTSSLPYAWVQSEMDRHCELWRHLVYMFFSAATCHCSVSRLKVLQGSWTDTNSMFLLQGERTDITATVKQRIRTLISPHS